MRLHARFRQSVIFRDDCPVRRTFLAVRSGGRGPRDKAGLDTALKAGLLIKMEGCLILLPVSSITL